MSVPKPPGRPVALIGVFPPPLGGQAVYNSVLAAELTRRGIPVVPVDVARGQPDPGHLKVGRGSLVTTLLTGRFSIFHLTTSDSRWVSFELITAVASLTRRVPFVYNILAGRFVDRVASYAPAHRLMLCLALRRAGRILVSNAVMASGVATLPLLGSRIIEVAGCRLPLGAAPEDDPELTAFLSGGAPSVVAVGALRPAYGFDVLVQACTILRERGMRPRLLIIVSGEEEAEAVRATEAALLTSPIGPDVRLCRDVPRALALGAIRQAQVLARPSRVDGDSLSIHEARALGTPVVASDSAPRPPGVILHASGDPHSLANGLAAAASLPREEIAVDDASSLVEHVIACYRALGARFHHD